eukprot:scaffold141530_cov22-Prasinocladus_malaysianus.AAC.1
MSKAHLARLSGLLLAAVDGALVDHAEVVQEAAHQGRLARVDVAQHHQVEAPAPAGRRLFRLSRPLADPDRQRRDKKTPLQMTHNFCMSSGLLLLQQ